MMVVIVVMVMVVMVMVVTQQAKTTKGGSKNARKAERKGKARLKERGLREREKRGGIQYLRGLVEWR